MIRQALPGPPRHASLHAVPRTYLGPSCRICTPVASQEALLSGTPHHRQASSLSVDLAPPYPLLAHLSMGGSSGLVLVGRLCVQTRVAPGSEYPYCDPAATLRASSDSLRPVRRFYPLGLRLSRTARFQSRTNAESGQAADLSH